MAIEQYVLTAMRNAPALVALSLLSLSSCTHEVVVKESPSSVQTTKEVIEVLGVGEATAVPNIVRLTLGVEAQGPDVLSAVQSVNGKMHALVDVLGKNGVAPKDIQTQHLDIHSEERPQPPEPLPLPAPTPAKPGRAAVEAVPVAPPAAVQPPIIYRVSNGVQVTLRDISRLGEAVGAAVQAGANEAWGIQFDVDDRAALLAQARQKAMLDARQRAQHLAQLGSVKLGGVLAITEATARDVPFPMPAMEAYSRAQNDVPIEVGKFSVFQSVKVVYAITP